jgi:UDP-N-acetylmuramoylalanine--D-glutamate ligase
VLLNITPDHLDRYESFEAYAASKARLFEMQSAARTAIFRLADNLVQCFDVAKGETYYLEDVLTIDPTMDLRWLIEFQTKWLTLQGPHNLENAAAAAAVCRTLGLGNAWIGVGLETYPGLPHRMERIRERDGVLFVNDSKATNPTATAPALAAFEKIRWICGGQAKTDNLDECAPYFGHVRTAYTIGEAAELFERLLSPHIHVKNCGKLDAAVRQAAADAEAGDTVLLSPACASFDQFRDFEDRGDRFRELVGGL